ncbi:predicted protein [Postia placenta Mad-698-R]|uniref:Glycosyltransferase family 2 protein n=1 Tax=Postia placenta MAD-698-R-SB12 TaxID=670580 RepID=A0A1X6MNI0_9APHY|nr:glycosyltransferase family 2 protein [Postia placenta MAD-698-R-SB12]EED81477.1 predicted protein [Postia placenta Mad-698-R]OSX57900.1 glycosyltransferase family 2 protein [Postia placenta MAD-698-R-SB12]
MSPIESPALQHPQASYFSPRRSRSFAASPSESRASTPVTPDVHTQLLTPNSSPSTPKSFSRIRAPGFSKLSKGYRKEPTRLQAQWIGTDAQKSSSASIHSDTSHSDSSSDADRHVPISSTYAAVPIPTIRVDSQSSGTTSSSTDNEKHKPFSLLESKLVDSKFTSDITPEAVAIIKPASIVVEGPSRPSSPLGLSARPPLSRANSSNKWAERLRQRSSQGSLSRSPSTSSLREFTARDGSSPLLRSPLASSSTPNLDQLLRPASPARRRSGKSIDEAIDFNRIRSPAPLSPSPSMPNLRDPFADTDVRAAFAKDARVHDLKPYCGLPQLSRANSTDSSSSSGLDVESEDEDDDGLGPPPEVPPALEYVDPEIECFAPSASTATLPLAEAAMADRQHPWSAPPFNIVERETPKIRKVAATFKITISLAVVISLLVGYGLRVKIVTAGPWSFGIRVNKMTKKSPIVKGVAEHLAAKDEIPTSVPAPLPECSIAVVGYREDEEAWTGCLKSLQAQEYPVKHIIGVVDGNDGPDLAMADAFGKAFPEDQRLISHLPVLLSVMYKEKYWEHMNTLGHPKLSRWEYFKMWLTQKTRPGQAEAHEVAWNHMLNYLHAKATEERWPDWKGICFSQPHGHKRHAMFTAFVVGAYALGTKDAMLTTDSDTYVYPDAVKNMMALLFSDSRLAGVTGDVRIWNKSESFLALMSSIRYWFAFNVERACQSAFGCVGCLSGPLGLYKTSDLISVLGPWILQSFLGKETTFGDDRHLSNRILSLGHKTGYTHLAMCDSDTPAGYVRWVKQQTRWSKSFFREAYWFPKSFAYHRFWLTVETTKQFLYPMVLTATVIHMLYAPSTWLRPLIWLGTMFGVAVIKSIYGVICLRDPRQFLFGIYGFMYFFGLLPSKLFACFTVHITNWGTSARSKSEFARPESFLSRTTHVGHLVVWYLMLSVGLGYLLVTVFSQPYFWFVGLLGGILSLQAYSDVIVGETKYAVYMLRKKWRARRANVTDVEKTAGKRRRLSIKKLRRSKKEKVPIVALTAETVPTEPEASVSTAPVAPPDTETGDARVSVVPPALMAAASSDPFSSDSVAATSSSGPHIRDYAQSSSPTGSQHGITTPSSDTSSLAIPEFQVARGRKVSASSSETTSSDEAGALTPDALSIEPALTYFPQSILQALSSIRKDDVSQRREETAQDEKMQAIADDTDTVLTPGAVVGY